VNKKKRIIKHFTNWLFEEYKAPRIPVRVMHYVDYINDNGTDCQGYFGYDNGEKVILVAAKRLGLTECLYVIAHEFVHYMQQLNGRNMSEKEIIEEDAYTFEKPLVGKYLINHKHIGERIEGILNVSVPVRLLAREG
jgi:hypothetical protein